MRCGVDAETGMVLTGWPHCAQSIDKCIRTRFATRLMHRHIGAKLVELQDENANAETIFDAYAAVADALNDPDAGEPGYNLLRIELVRGGRDGRFVFLLDGDFYPLGHLNDYSVKESRQHAVGFARVSA